jgi:predicted HTH domain antitoxin
LRGVEKIGGAETGKMATVQMQIPKEWIRGLEDQTTFLEVLSLGIEEYRIRRAMSLYQRGVGSLGYVADVVGISERVLLKESRQRGMLPHYDDRFIEQDLNQ